MVVDHSATARAVFDAAPPSKTVAGALDYVTRLLAALPANEHAGYLVKSAGDNIAPLADGTLVSVGRVCYVDGQIYKVMSDVPNGGPEWADDGTVDPARYWAFTPAASPQPTPVEPPPAPEGPTPRLVMFGVILKRLDELGAQSDANTEKIQQQIDQVVKNAEATGRALAPIVEAALPALSGLFVKK